MGFIFLRARSLLRVLYPATEIMLPQNTRSLEKKIKQKRKETTTLRFPQTVRQ